MGSPSLLALPDLALTVGNFVPSFASLLDLLILALVAGDVTPLLDLALLNELDVGDAVPSLIILLDFALVNNVSIVGDVVPSYWTLRWEVFSCGDAVPPLPILLLDLPDLLEGNESVGELVSGSNMQMEFHFRRSQESPASLEVKIKLNDAPNPKDGAALDRMPQKLVERGGGYFLRDTYLGSCTWGTTRLRKIGYNRGYNLRIIVISAAVG